MSYLALRLEEGRQRNVSQFDFLIIRISLWRCFITLNSVVAAHSYSYILRYQALLRQRVTSHLINPAVEPERGSLVFGSGNRVPVII